MSPRYRFTHKKHTYKGIMSTLLGIINVGALITVVYRTFLAGGSAGANESSTVFLTMIMAFVGIILGIVGKMESEKFYLFANLGLVLNILAIFSISAILYAGAYGFRI